MSGNKDQHYAGGSGGEGESNSQSEYSIKHPLAKNELDLFYDSDNIPMPVIRIKRISSANRERWKIIEDNKEIVVIDGEKLSSKERDFLRSVDGFSFLIQAYKNGSRVISRFKIELKKVMKTK